MIMAIAMWIYKKYLILILSGYLAHFIPIKIEISKILKIIKVFIYMRNESFFCDGLLFIYKLSDNLSDIRLWYSFE